MIRATLAVCALIAAVAAAQEWRTMPVPSGRELATLVADTCGDRALLFGGGFPGEYHNDAWLLSLDTAAGYRWHALDLTGAPPPRGGHASIYDQSHSRVLVFGGKDASGIRSDLWQLDVPTRTWSQVLPNGAWPAARAWFSGFYHPTRNSMIIFGGGDGGTGTRNDVWELDLDSLKWRQLSPSGTSPSGRSSYNAGLSIEQNMLVIISGHNGYSIVDEEWGLDLTPGAETWVRLTTTGDRLGARCNAATAIDPATDRLVCFGGFDYPGYIRRHNDVRVLDIAARRWTRLYPGGDAPVARRCATPLWDANNGNFIFFGGGTDNGYPGDLYYLNLDGLVMAITEANDGKQPGRDDISLPAVTRIPLQGRATAGEPAERSLSILDVSGRVVATPGVRSDGSFTWDGVDLSGRTAAAGTYFCRLRSGTDIVSRSFQLVR
jgi:hypothetical protein